MGSSSQSLGVRINNAENHLDELKPVVKFQGESVNP